MEFNVHMPMGSIVFTKDLHGANDLDAFCISRHKDLRLPVVLWRIGVGNHHGDHHLTARVSGSGDPMLLAINDPLIAVENSAGRDIGRVRRRHARLGHCKSRANLAL